MNFFIPQTKVEAAEALYASMADQLKDQMRWPITPRRIFALKYTHDKKVCTAKVGQTAGQGDRYIVMAIFESTHYIVFTHGLTGGVGTTILVNKDEITAIEDFA